MVVSASSAPVWQKFHSRIKNASVLLDEAVGEAVHWCGGLSMLIDCGATEVNLLPTLTPQVKTIGPLVNPSSRKLVLSLSSPLIGDSVETIRSVLASCRQHVQYVVIVTCVSAEGHTDLMGSRGYSRPEEVFEQFGEKVTEWMGDANSTVEVIHLPLDAFHLSPSLLLLPAHSQLLLPLPANQQPQNVKGELKHSEGIKSQISNVKGELKHSEGIKSQISALAWRLSDYFDSADIVEDCFSVGSVSHLLASTIVNAPPSKRRLKSGTNTSVIFMDRDVDLTSALSSQSECLLCDLFRSHDLLPGHMADVCVDVAPVIYGPYSGMSDKLPPGCLASSTKGHDLVSAMLSQGPLEITQDVIGQLDDAVSDRTGDWELDEEEEDSDDPLDRISALLQNVCGDLDWIEKNSHLVQVSIALQRVLRIQRITRTSIPSGNPDNANPNSNNSPDLRRSSGETGRDKSTVQEILHEVGEGKDRTEENLMSEKRRAAEKSEKAKLSRTAVSLGAVRVLEQEICLGVCGERICGGALRAMVEAVCSADKHGLRDNSMVWLSLLLYLYSIADPDQVIPGDLLLSFKKALMSDDTVSKNDFEKVLSIGEAMRVSRERLALFKSVQPPSSDIQLPAPVSALDRLASICVHERDQLPPDVVHVTGAGYGRLLSAGIGLFTKAAKPHPGNKDRILIFVLGGITSSEVRSCTKAFASSGKQQVSFASNYLITSPARFLSKLIG